MPDKLLILTALTLEAKALEPLLKSAGQTQLAVIGMRGVRMSDQLILNHNPNGIILAGLAGGLDPMLKVGDVLVDESANGPWPKLPYQYGAIHSSSKLISSPTAKAALFAQTGARAVDMESDIVRRCAAIAGLPLLTIRAISDAAEDEISPRLISCVDERGNPRPAALAAMLALHPSMIPSLIRLGKNTRVACARLTEAVGMLLKNRSK
ncbi:MAG: hypothetical protein M3O30_15720 [Planctomycetota bacterium]|nr:hypothetical protein [Planctomycetota bacterium]